MDVKKLALLVREGMKEKRLSIRELATMCEVSAAKIQQLRTGQAFKTKHRTVELLALSLGGDLPTYMRLSGYADSPLFVDFGRIRFVRTTPLSGEDTHDWAPIKESVVIDVGVKPEHIRSYKLDSDNLENPDKRSSWNKGGTAFFDTGCGKDKENLIEGDIYIFKYEGRTYIRQVFLDRDKFNMQSVNPKYKNFDVPFKDSKNLEIMGRLIEEWFYPNWL